MVSSRIVNDIFEKVARDGFRERGDDPCPASLLSVWPYFFAASYWTGISTLPQVLTGLLLPDV